MCYFFGGEYNMHKESESEIEIEVLPANEGDCILIKAVKEDIHILIDGGTDRQVIFGRFTFKLLYNQ